MFDAPCFRDDFDVYPDETFLLVESALGKDVSSELVMVDDWRILLPR